MGLIDPQKLALLRIGLDEMIVCHHLKTGKPLTRAVLDLFDEVDADLYTHQFEDGWWLASSLPTQTLRDFRITPTVLGRFERLYWRSQREEYINPISELVEELVKEDAAELASATVQASTEPQAILARLALELDSNADIFMSPDAANLFYPTNPSADEYDCWRCVVAKNYERWLVPSLRELHERLDFENTVHMYEAYGDRS